MKYLCRALCSLILFLLSAGTVLADTVPARLSSLQGEVMFRPADGDEWFPAAMNTPLQEGDAVWCPEQSRAEIQLPDGSAVRLDAGTSLTILSLDSSFIQIHASQGRLFVRTGNNKDQRLQIDADNTTVVPFGRTRLRVDLLSDGEEDVSIFKGSAYVEGNGNRTRVRAGEQLALEESGRNELLPLNPPDDWENWNADIDRSLRENGESARYLPEEIRLYAADLDANGQWVNIPEYGFAWRPTVVLAADWAPYRYGRWVWIRGDYVWVARESWGWAPYHYGRWVTLPSFGWCWVPPQRGDAYWGPGFVGWFFSGNNVGWVPLAPGETYYGRGHYGRHSVNTTNITVQANLTFSNYRNYSQRSAVTVVARDNFLKGRTVVVTNPRGRNSVRFLAGRPHLEPLRETRTPAVKVEQKNKRMVFPVMPKEKDLSHYRQQFPRVNAPPPREQGTGAAPRTSATPAPPRNAAEVNTAVPVRRHQEPTAITGNAPATVTPRNAAEVNTAVPVRRNQEPTVTTGNRPVTAPAQQAAPRPADSGRKGDASSRPPRAEQRKAWKVYGVSEKQEKRDKRQEKAGERLEKSDDRPRK